MRVFVTGSGPPLVLIPGIQGRWEWMRPAVRELAKRFRVVTFSLRAPGTDFDTQVSQVEAAMERAGVERAVLCGVSYGGFVALRCAAIRGARVSALVLVSTPGPFWRPDDRTARYVGRPWRSVPEFVLGARSRLWHETAGSVTGVLARSRLLSAYLALVAGHPPWPASMAQRVAALEGRNFVQDARAVAAPTLVITGEPDLDRVVPVEGTRQYLSLIPGSVGRTLERTGHIGLVTRPAEFARVIGEFVKERVRQA